jgi:hypothetical protein
VYTLSKVVIQIGVFLSGRELVKALVGEVREAFNRHGKT